MDICVVVVTYNRLNKLKKAIEAYDNQKELPMNFIVINNNSSDGTAEYLLKWQEAESEYTKTVINLSENIGGSGGFYYGLKKALEFNNKWIWVADDDAYPQENAFLKLNKILNDTVYESTAAVCAEVRNADGSLSVGHRRRLTVQYGIIKEHNISKQEYIQEKFNLDLFTYVGTILNTQKMRSVGLPKKEYFIWFDDTEHSLRMKSQGEILCYPSVSVIHDAVEGKGKADWKDYYGVRNRLDMYFQHYPKLKLLTLSLWLAKAILAPLKGYSLAVVKMRLTAIKDACCGKFGRHPIYGPVCKL